MRYFNAKHPQITKYDDSKLVSFRFQTVGGQWRKAVYDCKDFKPLPECTAVLPLYICTKGTPIFLALIRSRRYQNEGLSMYIGFREKTLMLEYLKKEGW